MSKVEYFLLSVIVAVVVAIGITEARAESCEGIQGINGESCFFWPTPEAMATPINCEPGSPNLAPVGSPQEAEYYAVEREYDKYRLKAATNQLSYNACKNRIYQRFDASINQYADRAVLSVVEPYPFEERCVTKAWQYLAAVKATEAYEGWQLFLCNLTRSYYE